jgi:hypothetical protein
MLFAVRFMYALPYVNYLLCIVVISHGKAVTVRTVHGTVLLYGSECFSRVVNPYENYETVGLLDWEKNCCRNR